MQSSALPRPAMELFPRVLELVRSRRTELAPSTMRVPISSYRAAAVHDAELAQVFGAVPLAVAPRALLSKPGDFVTRELPSGRSVIVSRGDDGKARVLVNACRHRGARVAEGAGCSRRFNCPYHGWSYDPAGALAGIPGKAGFDDIDPGQHGLVELPSVERYGIIWCRTEPGLPIDLDTHLGAFAEQLSAYGYDAFTTIPRLPVMEVCLHANWKCLIEAFYETYHFPFVHKNSVVGQGTVGNVVSFDAFGRHGRMGVPLATMNDLPEDARGDDLEHVSVLFFVYPNLVIANSPLGCEFIEARPFGGPDRTVLRHVCLSKIPDLDETGMNGVDALELVRAVVRDEDGPIIDAAEHGLASTAHDEMVIDKNEPDCQHIHRQLHQTLSNT